jgi:hypothetical protein
LPSKKSPTTLTEAIFGSADCQSFPIIKNLRLSFGLHSRFIPFLLPDHALLLAAERLANSLVGLCCAANGGLDLGAFLPGR